jgi:dTMP kinase
MYKKKPFFIVFEGVEGCGKSYQSQKLKKNLRKKGINSLLTREPGGTKSAESIRTLILRDYFHKGKEEEKFDRYTDTLLYLAARNEHIKNKIKPVLKKKGIVICDRFTDSTLAYQVYGKKVNRSFIDHIHKFILQGIKSNITFILKVSSKSSKLRLKKRKTKNRYDNFSQSFYTKAQKSFLKISKNKKNYFVLDSSLNNADLEKKIFKIVCKYLKVR